ncbi:hypothetical protein PTKIN_Ptkin13bG0003400 [Pterospermum kingtungense]
MANLTASPPANIGITCTVEELFISFNKLTSGSPLPSNVIDVNPYTYEPQNLPDDVWFLIGLKENTDMQHGFWNTIEETCEVFSNSDIIGWRTTLEYYEGQVPNEHKTDWVMQVYSITQKRLCDDNERKETSSLCRVFLVSSHEMLKKVSTAGIGNETQNNLTQPPALDAYSSTRLGSTSNREVNKHDKTEELAAAERLPFPVPEYQIEKLVEMEFFSRGQIDFFSGGDFMELMDLDNPVSSSSAESISSDECFDSMAFLQDLDNQILGQNDASRKLNVSVPNKSKEVLMVPATSGSLVSIEGSNWDSDEFFEGNMVTEHGKGGDEGPSSSHKPSTSSDSDTAEPGGKKTSGFGKMKNLRKKYLCFMPY